MKKKKTTVISHYFCFKWYRNYKRKSKTKSLFPFQFVFFYLISFNMIFNSNVCCCCCCFFFAHFVYKLQFNLWFRLIFLFVCLLLMFHFISFIIFFFIKFAFLKQLLNNLTLFLTLYINYILKHYILEFEIMRTKREKKFSSKYFEKNLHLSTKKERNKEKWRKWTLYSYNYWSLCLLFFLPEYFRLDRYNFWLSD